MAKGIPLVGRGPDGKAKMINVDENGNVKVQQSGNIVVETLHLNNASATGSGTDSVDISGFNTVLFEVSGTWTGRVRFWASVDGTTFELIRAVRTSNGEVVRDTFTNGIFQANIAGYKKVRMDFLWNSGSVTCISRCSQSAMSNPSQFDPPKGVEWVSLAHNAGISSNVYEVNMKHLVALTNDSDSDIEFAFRQEKSGFSWDLPGAKFILKPGETLNDMPLQIRYIYTRASADGKPWRVWGVK